VRFNRITDEMTFSGRGSRFIRHSDGLHKAGIVPKNLCWNGSTNWRWFL